MNKTHVLSAVQQKTLHVWQFIRELWSNRPQPLTMPHDRVNIGPIMRRMDRAADKSGSHYR